MFAGTIVVLFHFRRPPPSALALQLCQQMSASSGIVPARLGQLPAPPVPPQFLIVFQAVDGFLLLFSPPSCSHTAYNSLESINFSLWFVQSPPPAQNRQGGPQDFRPRQVHVLTEHQRYSFVGVQFACNLALPNV